MTSKTATLTLKNANDPKVRRDLVRWLRKQADHLAKHGQHYARRATAGFSYVK